MKSILLLIIVALLISGCSKTSDKEYYDIADKSMTKGNVHEAIKSFESLLSEYPDSKLAPDAMVRLAGIYQNGSDSTLTVKESYEKAAKLYREVYDKYPTSDKASTSLFMSGFVEANNLKNYDEATKTYQLFLEKYPDSQLAKSAREELNNMGMTPDEILKKNNNAKNI